MAWLLPGGFRTRRMWRRAIEREWRHSRSAPYVSCFTSSANAGNLMWAVGRHAALGYSPFGAMETYNPDAQLSLAYQALSEVMPQLTAAHWRWLEQIVRVLSWRVSK